MSNVVPLRKRSASYYTVRKSGLGYTIVLVTPIAERGGSLRTALSYFATRDEAVESGRAAAKRALLPYRERGQERLR